MKFEMLNSYKSISLGDAVELEDDTFKDNKDFPFTKKDITLPVKNVSYKVREIINTVYGIGIRLEEIKNKKFYFNNIKGEQEPFFGIARFKKIA